MNPGRLVKYGAFFALMIFAPLSVSAQTILTAHGLASFEKKQVSSGGGGDEGGSGAGCDSINDSSLISYWRLDETSGVRADTGPSGNTLTDTGSTGSAAGVINDGALFSSSSGLTHTSNSSLQCGGQDFSLSVWVKFSNISGSQVIVGKGNEYFLWINGGAFEFVTSGGGGAGGHLLSNVTPTVEVWYHVIITETAAGGKNIYVNGVSAGSITAGGFTSTSDNFVVGNYSAGGHPVRGTIDEVFLTKKVLTSTDVVNLYDSGLACRPTGL